MGRQWYGFFVGVTLFANILALSLLVFPLGLSPDVVRWGAALIIGIDALIEVIAFGISGFRFGKGTGKSAVLALVMLGLVPALTACSGIGNRLAPGTQNAQLSGQPATPTLEPTATVVTRAVVGASTPITGTLFVTPVKCTKNFNPASAWVLCEPGVILDNTAAWRVPETLNTYYVNLPEGGFTYLSFGQGTLTFGDGMTIRLEPQNGLNYLVLVRGTISDGIVDTDLNQNIQVSEFAVGHAIWSHMPSGAYVSRNWFEQQLRASMSVTDHTKSFTNCGDLGCSRTHVVLYDVTIHAYQKFEVRATNVNDWRLLESNLR